MAKYYGAVVDPGEHEFGAAGGGGGGSKWGDVFKKASARRTAGLPRALWEMLRGKVRERVPVEGELTSGSAGQMQTFRAPEGNRYLISTTRPARTEEWRHAAIREAEALTGRPAFSTEQMSRLAEGERAALQRARRLYGGQEPSVQAEETMVQSPRAMRELGDRMRRAIQIEANIQKALREFERARVQRLVE
mgnify:CR=1 FL=1